MKKYSYKSMLPSWKTKKVSLWWSVINVLPLLIIYTNYIIIHALRVGNSRGYFLQGVTFNSFLFLAYVTIASAFFSPTPFKVVNAATPAVLIYTLAKPRYVSEERKKDEIA